MSEKWKEFLMTAVSNLRSNLVRSILSVLGIVIGIASVIAILSLGAGAQRQILSRVESMGGTRIYVFPRYDAKTLRSGTLEYDDVARVAALPSVADVVPTLSLYKEIRSRKATCKGNVRGVRSEYFASRGYTVTAGRNFSPLEDEQRAQVCLLGESAAGELFQEGSPIGKDIFIEGFPWTVIGVVRTSQSKPRTTGSIADAEIFAPLTTLLRNSKDVFIQNLEIELRSDDTNRAIADIQQVMERGDAKRAGLYSVRDQREYVEKTLAIRRTLAMTGAFVAGISLIVGGIGMMNVMLTSVSERTREIGLRRAVGATKRDILNQFLVESAFLSGMGGILGLLAGTATARLIPLLFPAQFPARPIIEPGAVCAAAFGGILLGLVFGLYPAVRASHLSPAEALRSE